ncbi:dirigent protein 1 [Brachypodium distachyon]|uniref:Dirigent protein n=1 Tax=Brachypodium distachyon TaxID=15368 RepID=I1H4E5_BRADI|nr:dirigent protein 1 [Brachypodium distachyon]KQK21208.1 hypothetical protein BRADI_1g59380v3 [Brachypodium distachyon]|eukprot:XP_003557693.1 dirigent protein 1 [Brachypodium distachyon]
MASPAGVLLLAATLLLTTAAMLASAADSSTTTHLHFFLHDMVSGSNPTAVQIIKGPASTSASAFPGIAFGDTTVVDDALTETSSPSSAAVGRAQGYYMMSSQSGPVLMMCVNLLFTTGAYNGSTLAVLGRDDILETTRELPVVGGTGKFRMASGYVLWKTSNSSGPDATIELDVYVAMANGTGTIDASAPVSPIDGGGGAGGGAAGKSASGAAAAAAYGRWVSAFVVAVLVAMVGGVW